MSLGQRLKDRLFSLTAPTSASSAHNQQASPQYAGRGGQNRPKKRAGAKLLAIYEDEWAEIHEANEKNAKLASKCDVIIEKMHADAEKKCAECATLTMLAAQIPRLNEQLSEAMRLLGDLETSFGDVEVALLALEDTIDARQLQERQLDQRMRLAVCQEKRKAQYSALESSLKLDYDLKKEALKSRDRSASVSASSTLDTIDLNDSTTPSEKEPEENPLDM